MVRAGMVGVVNEPGGTAVRSALAIPDVQMAGKTGTSQVISAKNRGFLKGWEGETHALFIAFAPVGAPRYAAACVVEHGGGGSRAAAPVVQRRDDRGAVARSGRPSPASSRAINRRSGPRRGGVAGMKALFAEGLERPQLHAQEEARRCSTGRSWPSSPPSPWSASPRSIRWRAARSSLGRAATWCAIASASALLFVVALSDIRWWLRAAYPLYVVALAMLAAVIVIGVESGGAKRWLGYGELSFQPSEMMKIALVLALARYYQWLPPNQVSWPYAVLPPLLMIGAPVIACARSAGSRHRGAVRHRRRRAAVPRRRELGLFRRRFCRRHRRAAPCLGAAARLPAGAHPHLHRPRARSARLGLSHPAVEDRHRLRRLHRQGLSCRARRAQLNFLPEKHTDFIFTMFSEEMGFIGAAVLLALYLLVLLFITYMALRCRSTFPRLVAAGMGLCLFAYVFINVAMVTGLVPVVGVPLPLVSYGGTSMLTMMVGFGFVLNAHVNRETRIRREELGPFW